MATVHEFGTAPEQAKDGYKLTHIIVDTVDHARHEHGDDVRLVLGVAIHDRPNYFEMAVMVKIE